jgi:energy-converting hydrogenase Eha subunit C
MLFAILMVLFALAVIIGIIVVTAILDKKPTEIIMFSLMEIVLIYFIIICYFALKTPVNLNF